MTHLKELQESYQDKTILIITPLRNEDHSIELYVDSLKELDYPKELIDIYWLENDSTDRTLEMLEERIDQLEEFRSVTLESWELRDKPVKKQGKGGYWKDLPYAKSNRGGTWLIIWNDHFLPLIKESKVDYILVWFADALAPPGVITEYLKVFKNFPDAGWVGGQCHRRHHREKELCSPRPRSAVSSMEVVKVAMTAHIWMNPREPLSKCTFGAVRGSDMHLSLMRGLNIQGLYGYYQPSVYLQHISMDGKIYRTEAVRKL